VEHRRARSRQRRLSGELFDKLQARLRPAACATTARAKVVPGRAAAALALTCYFRKDGTPIWRRAELAAKDPKPEWFAPHF